MVKGYFASPLRELASRGVTTLLNGAFLYVARKEVHIEMKLAITAISVALLLTVSGGMALAAPPSPPGKDRGQGQEQAQVTASPTVAATATSGTATATAAATSGTLQTQAQATATPTSTSTQDEGRGQGRGRGNNPNQVQGQNGKPDQGQANSQDQGQGRGNNANKAKGPANKGAKGLDKRHGAAGVVQNKSGNGFDLQTNDGTIHVLVNSSTRFLAKDKRDATFADVSNNDKVNVNGTRDTGDNLVAKLVHKIPGQGDALFGHTVGTVVSYNAPSGSGNGSILVKDKRSGQNVTFSVTAATRLRGTPKQGDLVTVVGTKGTNTARGIVVHSDQTGDARPTPGTTTADQKDKNKD